MFNKAQQVLFKSKTILKAFKTTSLLLFNPKVILNKFNFKEEDQLSLSKSTSLVLSALDQRKIKQLLRKAFNNIYNKQL